jgi:hypothetical protein
MLAAIMSVGLLGFAAAVFLAVQRRGLFTSLLGLFRRCRIRISFLEDREVTLRALDRTIVEFYRGARGTLLLSTGAFVLGWLAEALEVFVILSFLSPPADPLSSIAIGALAVLIKGSTFFIPGSLGAQEGGNLLLVMAYGYSDLTGMAFAVFRRIRELVWIVIGLVCLAAIRGFRAVPDGSVSDDSAGV